FPSKGKYILCNNQLCSYLFLYHEAYEKMLDGEYDITLDLLMQIIDTDEETPYKMNSILLLPYVYRALDLDADELMMIYDDLLELGDEEIGIAIRYALPLLNILYEDYAAAVFNLSAIIENPYTEAEELLAILDQAWCILKLMDLGLRSMPEGAVFQSMTHREYRELEKEIFARVYGLENKEEETEKLPEIYELSLQNFPNPFNPDTTILFTIPNDSITNLEIFNIRGQKVRTLVNEFLPKGHHEVIWNGENEYGLPVASGVYFYRLQADEQSLTRRMVLLK
ncbi:MAG: T9SS type A sorting domain-containing protein, partial [Candidatus Cloacimonetes bacterium]|nr:T9SS type A sorting domain-containing protein [Candidatus Cloacimonadota bacterium]